MSALNWGVLQITPFQIGLFSNGNKVISYLIEHGESGNHSLLFKERVTGGSLSLFSLPHFSLLPPLSPFSLPLSPSLFLHSPSFKWSLYPVYEIKQPQLLFRIIKEVIGCRPISSRLMTVRLRASTFNTTIIQVYEPTSASYDDSEVDEFYRELQSLVDQTPKQDILVVQGDWNVKVGEDAQEDWKEVCGPFCNTETNDRGLKLLDFATFNNLVLANTLGNHKLSRRWTWHSPDGTHHNQIYYILVKKRFRSGIKTARTRTFPGADVGSDHDMVMMTFQTRLKNSRKPTQPRIRFDLEKLNDPTVDSRQLYVVDLHLLLH